jgi:hypothetical protein
LSTTCSGTGLFGYLIRRCSPPISLPCRCFIAGPGAVLSRKLINAQNFSGNRRTLSTTPNLQQQKLPFYRWHKLEHCVIKSNMASCPS